MTIFPQTQVPLTIPGCAVRYRADALPVGAVAAWSNSANGGPATIVQATGSYQPICQANQIHNNNAINFNTANGGTGLSLQSNSTLANVFSGDFTVFAVVKFTDGILQRLFTFSGPGGFWGAVNFNANNTLQLIFPTGAPLVARPSTSFNIYCIYVSGSSCGIQVNNGTFSTASGSVGTPRPNSFFVGSGASPTIVPLIGDIADIIIFQGKLSSADIISMNRYFSNIYGIAIS